MDIKLKTGHLKSSQPASNTKSQMKIVCMCAIYIRNFKFRALEKSLELSNNNHNRSRSTRTVNDVNYIHINSDHSPHGTTHNIAIELYSIYHSSFGIHHFTILHLEQVAAEWGGDLVPPGPSLLRNSVHQKHPTSVVVNAIISNSIVKCD